MSSLISDLELASWMTFRNTFALYFWLAAKWRPILIHILYFGHWQQAHFCSGFEAYYSREELKSNTWNLCNQIALNSLSFWVSNAPWLILWLCLLMQKYFRFFQGFKFLSVIAPLKSKTFSKNKNCLWFKPVKTQSMKHFSFFENTSLLTCDIAVCVVLLNQVALGWTVISLEHTLSRAESGLKLGIDLEPWP